MSSAESPEDAHEQLRDLAALYAVGALDDEEARRYRSHLVEGCKDCEDEVRAFEQTTAYLAFVEPATEPAPQLRSRLMERLLAEGLDRGRDPDVVRSSSENIGSDRGGLDLRHFLSIRADEGDWAMPMAGVLVKQLFFDEASGVATNLVRLLPGTSLPAHRHKGVEQLFILEGDCSVDGETLGPGDYHRAETASIHRTTHTVGGTLLLVVGPPEYEFIGV